MSLPSAALDFVDHRGKRFVGADDPDHALLLINAERGACPLGEEEESAAVKTPQRNRDWQDALDGEMDRVRVDLDFVDVHEVHAADPRDIDLTRRLWKNEHRDTSL